MSMSRNYSDLRLFVWLRERVFKIDKPFALGWGEWDVWRENTKRDHPLGWFMTETLPDILEKPAEWIVDPIHSLRYYVRMRWGTKSHLIQTKLTPGQYHEVSEKMLHGCFNELVDFVEVETASHNYMFNSEGREKYDAPWWHRFRLFRWATWRNPQAGLDHIRWETTLDHPDLDATDAAPWQAETAREKLALYIWWTQTRPKRPDPFDASGWSALSEEAKQKGLDTFSDNLPPGFKKQMRDAMELSRTIEEEYEAEDEAMLIRLIKIRRNLWT